jgi:sigma-54-dependent transcriptional regulator
MFHCEPVRAVEEFIKTTTYLSTERELNRLLNHIVSAARQITGAEAGRLYVLDQTKRHLYPEISQNDSVSAPLQLVPSISLFTGQQNNMDNICTYCAFSGQLINISDIYHYSGFDCTDLYEYDQRTGYRSQSLLTVPLRSYANITSGILQLINYRDPDTGQISPFPNTLESLVKAFASQAAVAIDNAQLIEQNNHLIELLNATNQQLTAENIDLKIKIAHHCRFTDTLIGNSAPMQLVFNLMEKVLDSDATVLIRGETGTGKELIAAAIHQNSHRRQGPFIAQNCAALPETLLESELFGYKRGAFSGAQKDKKGLIEAADRGTLFLDEIGDMPINLQAKLLRVLQDQKVRPLGALESRKVELRIITATHRDLETMIKEGQFREDLYYRLNVFPIDLPPLRARQEDLPALLQHFLEEYAERYNKTLQGFSPAAFDALLHYDYPGNIRELKNIVERAVLLSESGGSIQPAHLDKKLMADVNPAPSAIPTQAKLKEIIQVYEKQVIQQYLQTNHWNQTHTAKALGISRRGLVEKIRLYKIKKP